MPIWKINCVILSSRSGLLFWTGMTVRHHFTTHRWSTPYQRIFLLDRWWLPWGPPILTHWGILRIVWCLGTRATFSWTRRIQVFYGWGKLWTEKRETPIDCRFGPLTVYSTLTLRSRSRYVIAAAHTIYRHKFWIISSTPLTAAQIPWSSWCLWVWIWREFQIRGLQFNLLHLKTNDWRRFSSASRPTTRPTKNSCKMNTGSCSRG